MTNPILQKLEAKARKKAATNGVDLEGAVFVAHAYADGHERTLVVTNDRITVHDHGKTGTWTKKGRGVEIIAISKVTSIEVRKTGMLNYALVFHSSGNDLEYYDMREVCEHGRGLVTGLMATLDTTSAPAAPAPADGPLDQLKKLGELHAAGVLTDDEFNAKKAELLNRM